MKYGFEIAAFVLLLVFAKVLLADAISIEEVNERYNPNWEQNKEVFGIEDETPAFKFFEFLQTLGGIAGISVVIVEVVKRRTKNVRWLKDIPVVVYAVVIASGLTVFSHYQGFLIIPLETTKHWIEALISVSLTASALAVGAHSSVRNIRKTPAMRED